MRSCIWIASIELCYFLLSFFQYLSFGWLFVFPCWQTRINHALQCQLVHASPDALYSIAL